MLPIGILPMSNSKHCDRVLGISNIANQAIVVNAIAPQPSLLPAQRFADSSGIATTFDPLSQILNHLQLSLRVKLRDLLFSGAVDFNAPTQVAAPILSS